MSRFIPTKAPLADYQQRIPVNEIREGMFLDEIDEDFIRMSHRSKRVFHLPRVVVKSRVEAVDQVEGSVLTTSGKLYSLTAMDRTAIVRKEQ